MRQLLLKVVDIVHLDSNGMDVAQLIWLSNCLKEDLFIAENVFSSLSIVVSGQK